MSETGQHRKILVAPLNWGLGHATRCIPIIKNLLSENFQPVIAGDGASLQLLIKEFPFLAHYELPSYNIEYAKKASNLKYRLLLKLPGILLAMAKEKKILKKIIEKEDLKGIISDNRFGLRSDKIPSVYLTHQLRVLSGSTSHFTSKIHQRIISGFHECWIPDVKGEQSLSGELSQAAHLNVPLRFIGPLSRFSNKKKTLDLDLFVVLSGPEPQRSLLENKLRKELKNYEGSVLMVQGRIEDKQKTDQDGRIKLINFMLSGELERTLRRSRLVISRSGYSSIMDLEAIGANTYFVPTPGQFEQEYLAARMKNLGYSDFSRQDEFSLEKLQQGEKYPGFGHKKTSKTNFDVSLFDVFK